MNSQPTRTLPKNPGFSPPRHAEAEQLVAGGGLNRMRFGDFAAVMEVSDMREPCLFRTFVVCWWPRIVVDGPIVAALDPREGTIAQPETEQAKPAPATPDDFLDMANALAEAGDQAGAAALLARAEKDFPGDMHIFIRRSYLIATDPKSPETLDRWASVRVRHPDMADGHVMGAAAHVACGEFDAADAVLAAARLRLPDHLGVLMKYAYVAKERADWLAALQRFRDVLSHFPDSAEAAMQMEQCLYEVRAAAIDHAASGQSSIDVTALESAVRQDYAGTPADAEHRDLFLRFDSLGNNCEFGGVQRHFAAEPLGLFRFAEITTAALIAGINTGFPGVGDPGITDAKISQENGEFFLVDDVNGFSLHTFVFADREPDRLRFLAKHRVRLRFLRDKLLADLAAGEKIFVRKARSDSMPEEEIRALHAAIRRHGPAPLLCVQIADATHPAGTVCYQGDGLHIGYIERLIATADAAQVCFDTWLKICRSTADKVDSAEP